VDFSAAAAVHSEPAPRILVYKFMKALLFLALALGLSACAAYDGHTLRAGASSESEVRSVMGAPAVELADADGTKVLVYPHGPLGTTTYIARVGKDGTLEGVRQALTDGTFNQIQPGLTREEILRLIGPPGETMFFARLNQDSWGYRYKDTWGYLAVFSVNFDSNGVVVSKFTRRIERGPGFF
jgi:hypothetical protein